jgi:signal transduction histidine kinase
MEHALLNLFVNACQAMQGQGVLTVRVVQNPAGDCHLDVEDTGPGIEPKHLEHIFKPFYSTQNTGQGSGLGLALVDRVIREHDGHIEVDTEVGRGAIFHLTLPARVVVSHTDQDPS